jgi:DNA-binding PadR family transcriptional regulator
MANVWPATQSQLYGELHKLAEAGLIEVSDIGPRGRKEYRVTDAGRGELTRWITTPQDDPPRRSASLLRVFLLSEIPSAQAREYMVAVSEQADADLKALERLRESINWHDDDANFFGATALEYGLRRARLEGDWARWVVSGIDERAKD